MSKLRLRMPSASMVVAVTALVMALGGTSYAALAIPANSVGSKQLKKNAVTTKKVKNRAVTGAKIAKHTITGKNVKLSSLGRVPSATNATNAANLTGLKRYTGTVATPGSSSSSPNSVTLGTFGPFTVLGECYTNGTYDFAYTALESSQSGEWAEAYSGWTSGPLPANTREDMGDVAENDTLGDRFLGPDDGSWAAETTDGTLSLNGFNTQGVQLQGTSGPACSFAGYVISEQS